MGDRAGVPLIVFSQDDDKVAAVNSILREAGHPVHCTRVTQLSELEDALRSHQSELVLLFDDEPNVDLPAVASLLKKRIPSPPILIVGNKVDEHTIAEALECGAKDVVSLTHRHRFQAVVDRELQGYRLKVALGGVVTSANQYKQELRTLMDGTVEAIADLQEGIVVAANPNWLKLLGHETEEELVGMPFMDLCAKSDQAVIKGALVACLRGKWDDSSLKVEVGRADASYVALELNLEQVTIDGDPGIRVIVPVEPVEENTPAELVEQAVYKDPTTGFYHRHFFLEKLEERLVSPLNAGIRAFAYIRPDSFARVHDDIGILATENLLTELSVLLKDVMQPSDLYGRFGGTIFIALLERGTIADAKSWGEHVCQVIANQVFEVDNQSTSLTCTVGLCEIDTENSTLEEHLAEVEGACRKGRDAGGNCVELTNHSEVTQRTLQSDAIWVPRIRNALLKNRLRLVHQPITGLTEEVEGVFDTRVRMLDESDNIILPGEFVPAARRAGLLKNIDRWVIGASLSFCAAKRPSLIFVRLSKDSVVDNSLLDWLKARLSKARINPAQLCFQVSEEVASQHLKQTKAVAEALRELRFKFAVDHLGAGRDPDQVLNHVPMDFVKIDGTLMQGLHKDGNKQKTVGDLAAKASKQGIKPVAERIEDANTMAVLWQLGIPWMQGNYVQMHGVVLEDTQTVRGLTNTGAER